MSSDRVLDYLTEELVVAKNIVTYRSLSHALGIHVNHAKNELAFYHSEHAGSSDAGYATYVIGGEPLVSYLDGVRDSDKMAVDDEEMDEGSEDVPETKITLVREADLETSKEQYARIHFVHIYSLSPSPIHEPALLCEPAKNLRDAGKSIATGFTVALGRITGPDWYIKKRTDLQQRRSSSKAKPSATTTSFTSKNRLPGLSKAPSMAEDVKPVVKSEPKDVKPQIKEEPAKPAKPSGKLDFSKAKAKPPAAPAAAPKPPPETRKIKAEPVEEPPQAAPKPEHKLSRSKKDKSMSKLSDSDEEDESATARTRAAKSPSTSKRVESSKSAERVRRRVVISDDDEDEDEEAPKPPKPPPPPRTKAAYKSKAKARTKDTSPDDPEAEKELRAMMDIDDDQVTRVSHTPISISESATSPPATDIEMEDREPEPEPEPARAPTRKKTQRKPKKEVPMGRNGLKKKRVVKSRMTTDEKGYFVTEDYSEYESVDEEEAPPAAEKPAKGKGKGKGKKLTAPIEVKDEAEAEEATAKEKEKEKVAKPLAKSASTLKRKPSKPNVQKGGIASYFNKK